MTDPKNHRPSFAEVASDSGVAPLPPVKGRVPPPASAPPAVRPPAPRFEVIDDDGWLEGARVGLPRRRLRALDAMPAATLDLHGHDETAARRAVASFVAARRARGDGLVLVVVGRGRHSPGGIGVIRLAIAGWLLELGEHVLAFRTAAPDLGGDGAVAVLLAPLEP
jgi:DNA-nicking Smr family endonuclease